MSQPFFQVFECINPLCRMRFSTDLSVDYFDHCPKCNAPMEKIGDSYTNFQPVPVDPSLKNFDLRLVLDNIRSTLNVGSIFRSADGAGVKQIYCCGTTPTPEHPKIKKTSLGAETQLRWSYEQNAVNLVSDLITAGCILLALETTPNSISIFDISSTAYKQGQPIVLVVGNEVSGIDPGILEIADLHLALPMSGKKTSLNVAVSAGIALYILKDKFVHQPS